MSAEASPLAPRGLFIVGAPRSGTTLVQSLLAAHDELTSFTESHFFDRHYTPAPWGALLRRDPGSRLREFLAENGEDPPPSAEAFERARWPFPLLALQSRSVARQLLQVLDELAQLREASGWIEKTPMHLRFRPFLGYLSASARRTDFIHVIRQGLDVVASLREASKSWERAYDLPTCVRRWNRDLQLSSRWIDSPRDHFVVYEDLAADPEPVLRRLFQRLNLDWQPSVLEHYADRSASLVNSDETWKSGVTGAIRPSSTAKQRLTEVEQQQALRGLRTDLYDRLRTAAGES
ncbi:MAG: sulfotransferase [Acidobacteriota bacterium]